MSSKELDNLVQRGLLKKEPGDQSEFNGLVELANVRFNDAKRPDLSPASRFSLAYDAAHAFSLAALRWHGYRPENKRYIVFQCLGYSLGLKHEDWRVLDKCHNLRNVVEYAGHFNVDSQLLTDLLRVTEFVGRSVEKLGPISAERK
jgi:hypothetical protein